MLRYIDEHAMPANAEAQNMTVVDQERVHIYWYTDN